MSINTNNSYLPIMGSAPLFEPELNKGEIILEASQPRENQWGKANEFLRDYQIQEYDSRAEANLDEVGTTRKIICVASLVFFCVMVALFVVAASGIVPIFLPFIALGITLTLSFVASVMGPPKNSYIDFAEAKAGKINALCQELIANTKLMDVQDPERLKILKLEVTTLKEIIVNNERRISELDSYLRGTGWINDAVRLEKLEKSTIKDTLKNAYDSLSEFSWALTKQNG